MPDGFPDINSTTLAVLTSACELKHETSSMRSYMYSAIKRHAKSKDCALSKIPQFKRKGTPYKENGLSPSKNLMDILNKGHQTVVVTDSPHALVVSNFKVICQNGKEKIFLQVIDSLYGTKWAEAKKNVDWVDSDSILNNLNPQADFQWLEKAQ